MRNRSLLVFVSTTFNAVFSQAVSIVEGKKSVDVGVSLCYCNPDLCNQVRCDNLDDDKLTMMSIIFLMSLIHISITGHE